MKSKDVMGAVVFLCAWLAGASSFAGDNLGASIELTATATQGDTLSHRVLLHSAVETRVIHLAFRVPEDLQFISWEDADFMRNPLRIGPAFHAPSRTLLVALAVGETSAVKDSSGEVGVARFLRSTGGNSELTVLEACLVDGQHREDWIVGPEPALRPSPAPVPNTLLPQGLALGGASPNPMDRSTAVAFEVPNPGSAVTITIYDVTGREVRTLIDSHRDAGYHTEIWDLTNDGGLRVAPGIYFCELRSTSFVSTHKMLITR